MSTLLIVEDDPGLQSQMRWCFEDIDVQVADNGSAAKTLLEQHKPDVVTLDLGLPPDPGGTSEGMALLEHICNAYPNTKVIVVTGREEHEHAISAIAMGAYDFYQKPIDAQTLQFAVARAIKVGQLEQENAQLRQSAPANEPLVGLVAASPAMLELVDQVKRVAATQATVVINGETGTGKEIIARNLHALSGRSDGPLVTINCSAIPENLLESELFGHEKGSFTGAHARKIGKVEAANNGTLFLDEIGDMPLPLQSKILRFLQEREFERIGSNKPIEADVRVMCATHRDLSDMVSEQSFREDLFYRLSEFTLELPPLRDRGSDVLLIADHLVQQIDTNKSFRFTSSALNAIESWKWPGNVRELENRVRRAAIMSDDGLIDVKTLGFDDHEAKPVRTLKEVREIGEREELHKALIATEQNISETARLLGISRPTLYNLLEKFSIDLQEKE